MRSPYLVVRNGVVLSSRFTQTTTRYASTLSAPSPPSSTATTATSTLATSAPPPTASGQATSPTADASESADSPPDLSLLRLHAIRLYKELHRLGREYPDPAYKFNDRLRRAFEKNANASDPETLQKQLALGEHIKKEVLALISLKKYRHLRRHYHPDEPPRAASS